MKGKIMPRNLLVAIWLLSMTQPLTSETISNVMPDVPPGGLSIIARSDCVDAATKEKGQCVQEDDTVGNHYVVFKQDGIIMFIRQVTVDGYNTIYQSDRFNSF